MFASALSTTDRLSVIDPCNRTGKILIPASFVSVTKGVTDYLKHGGNPPPDVKDLSLCLLYQKGRCNAGNRCNQVHAAPEFVSQVRARALSSSTCCAAHGDVHSQELHASTRNVVVMKDGEQTTYTLADFAMTPSLETAMTRARTGPIRVQATRLCRLHLKGGCKFGRDCKNVHLCARATPILQEEPAAPLPIAAPPSLGLAFRAVDICPAAHAAPSGAYLPRDASANTSVSDFADTGVRLDARASTAAAATADVTPMSVLSIMSEFNSIVRPEDPLDIMDDDSNGSAVSSIDFGAFVNGLVQCGQVEPMASPQWIAA